MAFNGFDEELQAQLIQADCAALSGPDRARLEQIESRLMIQAVAVKSGLCQ